MKYRIGLDLGISSVGWAVLEHNEDDNPRQIVDLGVRVFDPAENPQDGSSLAVDRRIARGLRRRLRRKANRIRKTKEYLSKLFFNEELHNVVGQSCYDVYSLRYKALSEKLTLEELYITVLHFVKHRGFKSNRKSEQNDKETGSLLKAIRANQSNLDKYLTLGEYINCEKNPDSTYKFFDEMVRIKNGIEEQYRVYKVRNHSGSYDNCFARTDLENELNIILDRQSKFYPELITDDCKQVVLGYFNEQRSFDDGPNEPSPYRSNFAVGKCTLIPSEYRAPKGSFTFEYFNALNKLNNLVILDKSKQELRLTEEEMEKIIKLLFKGSEIKFATIRKTLELDNEYRFKNLTYKYKKSENPDEKVKEIDVAESEKSTYIKFDKVKTISKALGLEISKDNENLINAIAYILSMRKSDDRRINALTLNDDIVDNLSDEEKDSLKTLTEEQIQKLLPIDVTKFGNLSIKAMKQIVPYLEKGLVYDKACDEAGFDFKAISHNQKKYKLHYNDLIEELADITSPVVKRTISQTIKVINAIIDKYGSPCAIFIEFARELALNYADRKKVKNTQESRRSDNEKIEKKLREEFHIIPSGQDIVKYRLYEEQGGKCAYSGVSFEEKLGSPRAIFDNNATQIDHIIPYSQCYDDSYNNKVLVLSSENQKKGNRVPKEYMSEEQFIRFEDFVKSQYAGNYKKQANLLHNKLTQDQITELNSRALNDTKYSARLIKQVLENHLQFADSKFNKVPVRCVNGKVTSYLRKIWGLTKHRFESDKHHAQDAAVIATATNGMIMQITDYFQKKSYQKLQGALKVEVNNGVEHIVITETGESIPREEFDTKYGPQVKRPYELFSKELYARLMSANPKSNENIEIYQSIGYTDEEIDKVKPVFISRMPTRKVLGQIHEETIRSVPYKKDNNKKYVATRTSIENLKLNKDKTAIEGYSEKAKKDDKRLYNALLSRLIEFGGDAKKAFADGFYKPKADGTKGNPVRNVKTEKVVGDGVAVNNGHADKSRMVRVDIFTKDNKNYVVPVYVSDVYAQKLPNLACVASKQREDWLDITQDGFEFKFSLYPNDLVYISNNKPLTGTNSQKESVEINNQYLYYKSTSSSTGALTFINHDKSVDIGNAGIQRLNVFKKCTVDVLGNVSEVKHNTRQPLELKKRR